MIKHSLFFIVAGGLVFTSAYCNTEIKAPEGPFVSLLRTTFSGQAVSVNVKKVSVKEKVYNFQVPDLGRYQERTPATTPSQSEPINVTVFPSFDQIGNESSTTSNSLNSAPFDMPDNEFKELNTSPYALSPINSAKSTKSNLPNSFDSLPIEYKQSDQERSYPSEWASPFSNQQLHSNNAFNMTNPRNPRQNQGFITNKKNQPSPMMGMPFSNQMPHWPLGNSQNSNTGYN